MFASRGASKLRATTRLLVRSLASRASSDYSSSWQPLLAGTAAVMTAATILSYPNNKTVLEASTPTIDSSSPDDSFVGATTLLNWSGTHAVHTKNFWEPETMQELEELIQECHNKGKAVRPLGSALSPNGIGFQSAGMVSLANLDEILEIDTDNMTVTVQAGARVSQVVEALRPYGLTLPNLASIAEQQMGGFVQVGAHGTGAKVAPVDHYVTKLRLITPARGSMVLTEQQDGELFHLAKVGLGCLGVVAEVTMQCIPAHALVEHTFVLTRKEAREQLEHLLEAHKHMRFMWIPYADAVVVVTNDPEDLVAKDVPRNEMKYTEAERFAPLHNLLVELSKETSEPVTMTSLLGMGFGELRDALLAMNPLDVDHVKLVNEAEAEFWRKSQGYQTKPSEQLLQFDCGGQQWVLEMALPTGTMEQNNGNDMNFMEKLLEGIEDQQIPAHSPIEQRWTASSSSLMSPAHGTNGLHSWVGIIMYLPSADNEHQRRAITERFRGQYCDLMHTVGLEVNAASHWAKLELPTSMWKLVDLQTEMQKRYPLRIFQKARQMLDPKDILGNPMLNLAFGSKVKNPDDDLGAQSSIWIPDEELNADGKPGN
jgi:L-galactono-1,4-lactone dehydrogenase